MDQQLSCMPRRERHLTSGGCTCKNQPDTSFFSVGHTRFRAELRVETWQDSHSMRFRRHGNRKKRERCRWRQQIKRAVTNTAEKWMDRRESVSEPLTNKIRLIHVALPVCLHVHWPGKCFLLTVVIVALWFCCPCLKIVRFWHSQA